MKNEIHPFKFVILKLDHSLVYVLCDVCNKIIHQGDEYYYYLRNSYRACSERCAEMYILQKL